MSGTEAPNSKTYLSSTPETFKDILDRRPFVSFCLFIEILSECSCITWHGSIYSPVYFVPQFYNLVAPRLTLLADAQESSYYCAHPRLAAWLGEKLHHLLR